MARIEYTGDALVVHVEGWDRIWALKSQLTIPMDHVVGAEPAAEEARHRWQGLKVMGTHIPGVIAAGTFYSDGGWVFWDVHDADRAVAIHLRDERYTKLVIEVGDPAATIALVNGHARP